MTLPPTRLRQIAFLAGDLSAAEKTLTTVFGTEVIYRDPHVAQWGLQNFLVPLGGDILEVCSPVKDGTSGSRFLTKRGGDCGYMIIMQTGDAEARRRLIESKGLARVAWSHSEEGVRCVQYSPKGIPGGVMPELDSHGSPTDRFGPWYPCGPDYRHYATAMARTSHLQLLRVTCRLAPGNQDTESAAKRWEEIFGVERHDGELVFTNMRLRFDPGLPSMPEGLESITVGIQGNDRYREVLSAAKRESKSDDGRIVFLGVEWHLVCLDGQGVRSRM